MGDLTVRIVVLGIIAAASIILIVVVAFKNVIDRFGAVVAGWFVGPAEAGAVRRGERYGAEARVEADRKRRAAKRVLTLPPMCRLGYTSKVTR